MHNERTGQSSDWPFLIFERDCALLSCFILHEKKRIILHSIEKLLSLQMRRIPCGIIVVIKRSIYAHFYFEINDLSLVSLNESSIYNIYPCTRLWFVIVRIFTYIPILLEIVGKVTVYLKV